MKLGVVVHAVDVFQRLSGGRTIPPDTPDNEPSSSSYIPSYGHRKLPRLATFVNDNWENFVNQPYRKEKK